MNRFTILLLGIIIFGCSNQSSELLKNGLTKKANKVTEYFVTLQNQNKESTVDTLAIIEKYYNDSDQITKRFQKNIFDESNIEIDFEYNNFGKIKKEIVTMSRDNSKLTVDYIYKDSLLIQTYSETKNDIFNFKQIGEYKYNSNDSLVESSTSDVYFDLESKDTTFHSVVINKYDKNEFVTESKSINYLNPLTNNSTVSEYENGLLIGLKKYDSEGSIISTTNYKYEFDKYENWIKRELYENNVLKSIKTREIDYK